MDFTLLLVIITLISGILLMMTKLVKGSAHIPQFLDFLSSLFPILLFVLVFRSFVIEPYRIPSGSMIPTLVVGDFILVNKYEYGLRVPLSNDKFFSNNKPNYGDIIVFQYPQDKKINYIKRVVALPGDYVEYINKELRVNGKKYSQIEMNNDYLDANDIADNRLYSESNNKKIYQILKNDNNGQNFSYTVPQDMYFVLGDNRDNSNDSRYWGPVPEENLIGKAFFIWMHWNPISSYAILDRAGKSIE